jgi:hypothetical protein
MGIIQRTPDKEIKSEIERQKKFLEDGIIFIMNRVGLEFIVDARDSVNIDTGLFPGIHKMTKREMEKGSSQPQTGDYLDDTEHLRSSIGYFVLHNGIVIKKNVEGKSEGVSAAISMLAKIPTIIGFQLIGVAGKDYASFVESQGFNVITSQANIAMVNLQKRLQTYADKKGMTGISADMSTSML